MSFIGDKLREFGAMADQAMEGGPSFNAPVSAKVFARLESQVIKLELAVADGFANVDRKLKVLDQRQETGLMPSTIQTPKPTRRQRKVKAKAKTEGIKRKRRTRAQMLADEQG